MRHLQKIPEVSKNQATDHFQKKRIVNMLLSHAHITIRIKVMSSTNTSCYKEN